MSEEIKNLNEQPEQAPVEEKLEAPKKPLDKKTIGIIAGAAAAVLVLVLVLVLALGGAKDYTLGMGAAFGTMNGSQTNITLATVVLDKDGKIVECRIDVVQNKYKVEDKVNFTVLDTKMELGDKYGMAGKVDNNNDGVMLEWYEQTKAFEAYVVGMTADQVKALETQEVNAHNISKDEALLSAGCTIDITDFKAAVVKACTDEYAVAFKAKDFTLGIAANSADNGSSVADGKATVKMNVDFAASVVANGKIVASLNDAAQPQINIDGENITASAGKNADPMTKRELKGDYGMEGKVDNNKDGVMLEWFEQSAAFSAYVIGLTGEQVNGLETQEVNAHNISTDEALLSAGCSIDISGIKAVVAESVANAR